MFRITLPMVKPAILSTILLVFGSAMGSYPVPHYSGTDHLSTKYISMNPSIPGKPVFCHHRDDLWCGDPVNEPDELKEP